MEASSEARSQKKREARSVEVKTEYEKSDTEDQRFKMQTTVRDSVSRRS
jgi:hypothetical protein